MRHQEHAIERVVTVERSFLPYFDCDEEDGLLNVARLREEEHVQTTFFLDGEEIHIQFEGGERTISHLCEQIDSIYSQLVLLLL